MQTTVSSATAGIDQGETVRHMDASFIDQIWHDLDGQVSRAGISRAVAEEVARFQDARIRTFVPIFIRRGALEKLLAALVSGSSRPRGG